mgnify:CR=1 FL=1
MYGSDRKVIIKTKQYSCDTDSKVTSICVIIKLSMLAIESSSLLHSLRKTKTVLLAVSLTLTGLLTIMLSRWLAKMTLDA